MTSEATASPAALASIVWLIAGCGGSALDPADHAPAESTGTEVEIEEGGPASGTSSQDTEAFHARVRTGLGDWQDIHVEDGSEAGAQACQVLVDHIERQLIEMDIEPVVERPCEHGNLPRARVQGEDETRLVVEREVRTFDLLRAMTDDTRVALSIGGRIWTADVSVHDGSEACERSLELRSRRRSEEAVDEEMDFRWLENEARARDFRAEELCAQASDADSRHACESARALAAMLRALLEDFEPSPPPERHCEGSATGRFEK